MYNKSRTKCICVKCNARIPKSCPVLICSICTEFKHYKCHKLSKTDAKDIINYHPSDWICGDCTIHLFPVNACEIDKLINKPIDQVYKPPQIKCQSCNKTSTRPLLFEQCKWCDKTCHKKCIKNELAVKNVVKI